MATTVTDEEYKRIVEEVPDEDADDEVEGPPEESKEADELTAAATKKNKRAVKLERQREIVRRLQDVVKGELQSLMIGSIAMLVSALSNQAFPRLMGRLIDQKSSNSSSSSSNGQNAYSLVFSLGFVVVGGGTASFLRTTLLRAAEDRIASALRQEAFQSLLLYKDLQWFQTQLMFQNNTDNDNVTTAKTTKDKAAAQSSSITHKKHDIATKEAIEQKHHEEGVSAGAIVTILTDDVDKVSSAVTTSLANILRSSSSVLFSTYHMLSINASLFAISFTVVPTVGAAAMYLQKSIQQTTVKKQDLLSRTASFVEERISHIAMVKMSNRQHDEVANYKALQEETVRVSNKASMLNGMFMGFVFAATSSALLLVVHAGGRAVAAGKMSSGQLTSFATYSFLLGLGTSGILKAVSECMQGLVSADRFYKLIDSSTDDKPTTTTTTAYSAPGRSTDGHKPKELVKIDIGKVESLGFKNVSFGYKSAGHPSRPLALKDVTFSLNRGQVIALVGRNGSGKSTTASLLAGLYEPTSGQIQVNPGATNIAQLDEETKRKLVQVIPQTPALFNVSILENVRYSNPSATEDEVRRVLTLANCDSFIAELKDGIHFSVGLNGVKLSAGQRQRIALARALLSDPAFLVMDEPAASMDAEGESAVRSAVLACRNNDDNKKKMGRTLLLITHKAKSLELADEIYVLEKGVLVEKGQLKKLGNNKNSALYKLMPGLE